MADTAGVGGKVASVMQESRVFPPPAEFARTARIGSLEEYRRLSDEVARNPDAFWDARGRELPWTTPYTQVLDWQPPVAKWFVGGRTNASAACLDQQIAAGRGDKAAITWVGEPAGERPPHPGAEPGGVHQEQVPARAAQVVGRNRCPIGRGHEPRMVEHAGIGRMVGRLHERSLPPGSAPPEPGPAGRWSGDAC
jgi:hypothetical protein